MSEIFRIASPQITSEIIDGEVMIINLKNGNYYSMSGAGAEIWTGIQKGTSSENLVKILAQVYEAAPEIIDQGLKSLLQDLQQEELVAINSSGVVDSSLSQGIAITGQRRPFEAPVLNKYTDMQELLLLDPIHDVDEGGWPRVKEISNP